MEADGTGGADASHIESRATPFSYRLTMRASLPFALLITAAFTAPALPAQAPYGCEPAEIQFASGTGRAVVEGQAFLKTQSDVVKYGAGNQVQLVPVCAGSTTWLAKQIKWLAPVQLDSSVARAMRTTTADAEGRFRFSDVPAGEYYVVSSVWWRVPGRYQKEGGYVAEQVHAVDGQTASIVVTDKGGE